MPDPFKILGVAPERAKQGAAYAGSQGLDLLYTPLYMKALGDALSSLMGPSPARPEDPAPTPEAAPYQALTGALMEPLRRVGEEQQGRVAELEALYPQFLQEALTGMRGLGEQYGEANPELGPVLAMMQLFRPDAAHLAGKASKLTGAADDLGKVSIYPWHMRSAASKTKDLISPERVAHHKAFWEQTANRYIPADAPISPSRREWIGHSLANFEKAVTGPKHRRVKRMKWWLDHAESMAKSDGIHDSVDWAPLRRLIMKHSAADQ